MADIPPILGSAAQAGYQQADVSKARDAEKSGRAEAGRREAKAIDEAGSTIEANDEDVAVFADAEGAGGQGRSSQEESNDAHESDQQADEDSQGFSTDSTGQTHVDLEA